MNNKTVLSLLVIVLVAIIGFFTPTFAMVMVVGITSASQLKEGDVLKGIMYRRIFKEHKNLVQVTVGPTGSGKSYQNLREVELWYEQVLKRPFPLENITFSPEAFLARVEHYGNLAAKGIDVRGEIIIFEEAGVSMGALDFSTNIAKAVNYVLQSFRSMQIILLLNLPYFSMLNKTTRMLCHLLVQTNGIDKAKKQCMVKAKFLHYDQTTGKPYFFFPKVQIDGYLEKIEQLGYKLPSDYIRIPYEQKKAQFLQGVVTGSRATIEYSDKKRLTPIQAQIYNLLKQGMTVQKDIALKLDIPASHVCTAFKSIRKKGYPIESLYENITNDADFAPAQPSIDVEKSTTINDDKELPDN